MASGGNARERLIEIWTEWGLAPDTMTSDAQFRALDAVETWLKRGEAEPEIVIQAVQILRADPERPDGNKRGCCKGLRKAVTDAWSNVGTAPEHLYYAQALLLAVWTSAARAGWFATVPLLDSTWQSLPGRGRQRKELSQWRSQVMIPIPLRQATMDNAAMFEQPPAANDKITLPKVGSYAEVDFSALSENIQNIRAHAGNQTQTWAKYIANAFDQCQVAIKNVSAGLQNIYKDLDLLAQNFETFGHELSKRNAKHIQEFVTNHAKYIQKESQQTRRSLTETQAELRLLWWGQSRYCEAERKPYRLIPDSGNVLWWTSREAAELSTMIEIEPAAAYLAETLHSLGHDIFEKKPLKIWMVQLHNTLTQAAAKVPALSERLTKIAKEDALGLPVTWTRLQAARKEPLTTAADALAIDLDIEIDRGEWASWIFRETLLDLRLGKSA